MTDPGQLFDDYRGLLFDVAYRMLGSVSDAEDVVQEAWFRWERADREAICSPKAWLCTTVTRLAIDHLRSARVRRERYVGPWLPEPLVCDMTDPVPEQTALAESLSMAFLVMLERLTPIERAVFLLREVFELDYDGIAEVVDKTASNCRQIFRRARLRLAGQPRYTADDGSHSRLLTTFMQAMATGNVDAIKSVLADDVTLWSDGGGAATAARNPIQGADRVARFLVGVYRKGGVDLGVRTARINGVPGLVTIEQGKDGNPDDRGRVVGTVVFDVEDGLVAGIRIVVNPHKLANIAV